MFHMANQHWRNTPKEKITTPPHIPSYGLPPCRGGGARAFQWSWELSRQRHVSLWQVQPSRKDRRGETRPKGSQHSNFTSIFSGKNFFPCAFHITFLHYNETYYKLLNFHRKQISHCFIKIWNALKNVKM